ncbi:hypothetical protein FI667_g10219, partial [Globisporangium splendens]
MSPLKEQFTRAVLQKKTRQESAKRQEKKGKNSTAKHASYTFRLGRGEHSPDRESCTSSIEDSASAAAEREEELREEERAGSIAPSASELREESDSSAGVSSLEERSLLSRVATTVELRAHLSESTRVAAVTGESLSEQDMAPPAWFTTSFQDLRSEMCAIKDTLATLLNSDLRAKNARIVDQIRVDLGS